MNSFINHFFIALTITIGSEPLYGQTITRSIPSIPSIPSRLPSIQTPCISITSVATYPYFMTAKTIAYIKNNPKTTALTAAGLLCAGGASYLARLFFFPEPLIIHATRSRNLTLLKSLVFLGFDKEKMDSHNTTPLGCAIESENLKAVEFLCNAGANANGRWGPSLENTPLNNWHIKNNDKIAKCLIDHGAHVNNRDSRHYTALRRALIFKHLKTAQVLVENGAKLFLPELDKNGANPWRILEQEPIMALEFFQSFFPLKIEEELVRPLLKATLSEFIKVMNNSVDSAVLTEQVKKNLTQMDSGLTTQENQDLISIVHKFINLLYSIPEKNANSPLEDENLHLSEEENDLCERLFVIE